jgi:hypothetical protein
MTEKIIEITDHKSPIHSQTDENPDHIDMEEEAANFQENLYLGDADAPTYVVESIQKEKQMQGKRYFFVKWLGYPSSQNTWEPFENL